MNHTPTDTSDECRAAFEQDCEPVSVSLARCADAVEDFNKSVDFSQACKYAKTVLDSAKQQGARIVYVD